MNLRIPNRVLCIPVTLALLSVNAHAQFLESGIEVLYTLGGRVDNERFSLSPAAVGDINGDGISEIVCNAPGQANDDGTMGVCVLINGADGLVIREHPSPLVGVVFQRSAEMGDVNGDGVPDYGAGAWGVGMPGVVRVFSGSNGEVLLTIHGLTSNDQFGLGLAPLGDVNNDGHADIIIGAPFHRTPTQPKGRVGVYSGVDGSELWAIEGSALHQAFGQSCFAVDDADSDGVRDVLVASPQMRPNFQNTGPGFVQIYSGVDGAPIGIPIVSPSASSVYFGAWIPSPIIDLDGDGVNEIILADQFDSAVGTQTGKAIVFDGATRTLMYEVVGSSAFQGMGATANAGDIDGDGFDDLIATSWRSPDGAPGLSGKLEIFGGLSRELLGTITADSSGGNFGGWVFSMGDVNLDGSPDFFVNAPSHSVDGPARGRLWVVSGCSFINAPGDITGDGLVDIFDVFEFIELFNTSDPRADFQPDGILDVFDVFAFIGAFNSGRCTG